MKTHRGSYYKRPYFPYSIWLIGLVFICEWACQNPSQIQVKEDREKIRITSPNYHLEIQKSGFKFRFMKPEGEEIAPAHLVSGLQIAQAGGSWENIHSVQLLQSQNNSVKLEATSSQGLRATIELHLRPHAVQMAITPQREGEYHILARTGGMGPAYGMGDHAARGEGNHSLVLENFVRDPLKVDHGGQRMISNFVIFPKQGFASVNVEPNSKIIRIREDEHAQGSRNVRALPDLYYFIGTPREIYREYLNIRMATGYPVYAPKHEWFGVGWEAFGALAWRTNRETVTQNIDQYLSHGYPLNWMVVGSGFWPRGVGEFDEHGTPYTTESATEAAKRLQATTSFGMWDPKLYPNPKEMIDEFHQKGLIFTIGLRLGFIPGGPFTDEGVEKGYFMRDSTGENRLFTIGFPRSPIYFLNTQNPAAVSWYVGLCKKWMDHGVDGFKEDLFHWPDDVQDDLIDPINRVLMDQGVYIMGRNNYLGSPADIHRYDDFNYNQFQDRGPINGLAYAFSGFPNVYPDIIGGTGLATGRFGSEPPEKLKTYIIRYAQYASLNPSMAFGFGPWNFDEETNQLCLEAALLHHRLKPHIYSNAIQAYHTGFPYPLTPLPLAYPEDEQVYGLADTSRRSYEWMIGESLLAAPLYGDDYPTAFSRDIYLPEGKWMDYESGEVFEGGQMLIDFPIPLEKTPLFVGGTGVVIEQENDQLLARIYPLNKQSETVFWDKNGNTQSNIHVNVQDWDVIRVVDKESGRNIAHSFVRHAHQFVVEPGKDYEIQ